MAESGNVLSIMQKMKDITTDAIKTISVDHSEIHDGSFHQAILNTSSLGASSWLMMQINTPSSDIAEIHMFSDFNNSGGAVEFLKIGSPTTMINGNAMVTVFNNNRKSTKVSSLVIFSNPTGGSISSTATSSQANIIYYYYEGSTGGNQGKNASNGRDANEWILKANSTYVYKITNLGSAGLATLRLNWYEV